MFDKVQFNVRSCGLNHLVKEFCLYLCALLALRRDILSVGWSSSGISFISVIEWPGWLKCEIRNLINDHLVLKIHKIEKILNADSVQFSGSLRTWRIVILLKTVSKCKPNEHWDTLETEISRSYQDEGAINVWSVNITLKLNDTLIQ